MGAYLIRRLLLVIPTLWAITINFLSCRSLPVRPVDHQAIAAIEFGQGGALPGAFSGEGVRASHARKPASANISDSHYRGGRGDLDPEADRGDHPASLRFRTNRCMSVISRCYGTISLLTSATVCFAAHPRPNADQR